MSRVGPSVDFLISDDFVIESEFSATNHRAEDRQSDRLPVFGKQDRPKTN
jgi:hypothetical protein